MPTLSRSLVTPRIRGVIDHLLHAIPQWVEVSWRAAEMFLELVALLQPGRQGLEGYGGELHACPPEVGAPWPTQSPRQDFLPAGNPNIPTQVHVGGLLCAFGCRRLYEWHGRQSCVEKDGVQTVAHLFAMMACLNVLSFIEL